MLLWRLTVYAFEPGFAYPCITHVFCGETQEQVCETYHRHLQCDVMLTQLTMEGLTCEQWDSCECPAPGGRPLPEQPIPESQPLPTPAEPGPVIPPDPTWPQPPGPGGMRPPPRETPRPGARPVAQPPMRPAMPVTPNMPHVPIDPTARPGGGHVAMMAQPVLPLRPVAPSDPTIQSPPLNGGRVDPRLAAQLEPWLRRLERIR